MILDVDSLTDDLHSGDSKLNNVSKRVFMSMSNGILTFANTHLERKQFH
jgi:hypothetical protein